MAKKFDFDKEKNNRNSNNRDNNTIEEIMQADFPLPKQAEDAKNAAFVRIREMAAASGNKDNTESTEKETVKEDSREIVGLITMNNSKDTGNHTENIKDATRKLPEKTTGNSRKKSAGTAKPYKKFRTVYKAALGMTAAAAVFSAACITNPAFAENIPLVGNVFEQIGNSLGFSGDFSKYATPLEDENTADNDTQNEAEQKTFSNGDNTRTTAAENGETTDSKWSQTYNGTTLTVSEVYCNDTALYISLIISMEDKIPNTLLTEDGTPYIRLDNGSVWINCDFNEGDMLVNAPLDGQLIDDHTFAGVLRIDNTEFTYDFAGETKFNEAWEKFWKEKGIDEPSDATNEEMAAAIGIEDAENATQEDAIAAGAPDEKDYLKEIKVPDQFNLELRFSQITGQLPEDEQTVPDIPQELRDEHDQAVADAGLNEDDYENFTEEQKETLRQIDQEMYNKYTELYPDVNKHPNKYENWWVDGDWDFTIPVEKNNAQTETIEIQAVDSEGNGVTSLTKTPFEITMNESGDTTDYFPVILDADGKIMSFGKFEGTANTVAISNSDISTVYVYLCDYDEYMDELKGYYWSEDYEEKAKTKTFKQLLDDRAIASAEVHFD